MTAPLELLGDREQPIFAAPQQVRTVSDNVTNADFVTSRP